MRTSHPTRGAWIEINNIAVLFGLRVWSHPTRGAWIEMHNGLVRGVRVLWSHPTRGAWIVLSFPSFKRNHILLEVLRRCDILESIML